jgi:NAD(P)-dependent dehydrogenase (short-subunit alcohol dehydrogenase family)
MSTLQNKVAVVTGGNSGIGYATAKELKEQGATVIITGRRKEAVEEAATALGVTGIVADQASLAATDELVTNIEASFGKVDILFINAGIATLSSIETTTEEHFDGIMDINFKGAFFTLSKFIPLLKDGSSVIFLSSIVATTTHHSTSVYSASKAALNAAMKTAAVELAPRKIRVNAVSPGPIKTNVMQKAGLDAATLEQITSTLVTKIPMARMGEADEVARLVAYLAADTAGFITGSEFVIDGGITLN